MLKRQKRSWISRALRRFAKDQRGVTTLEYIVIAVLICAACVGIFMAIQRNLAGRANVVQKAVAGDVKGAADEAKTNLDKSQSNMEEATKQGETIMTGKEGGTSE